MTLDVLRGIQGIGPAALIPASVRVLLTSTFARPDLGRPPPLAWNSCEGIPLWTFTTYRIFHFLRWCRNGGSLL